MGVLMALLTLLVMSASTDSDGSCILIRSNNMQQGTATCDMMPQPNQNCSVLAQLVPPAAAPLLHLLLYMLMHLLQYGAPLHLLSRCWT
jgi:hypothetical protein